MSGTQPSLLELASRFEAHAKGGNWTSLWPPYLDRCRQEVVDAWLAAPCVERDGVFVQMLQEPVLAQWVLQQSTKVPSETLFHLILADRAWSMNQKHSDRQAVLRLASLALTKGADPNASGVEPITQTPFSVLEMVLSGTSRVPPSDAVLWIELLIGAGADPSLKVNPEHGPPLEFSLRFKTPHAFVALLDAGADRKAITFIERRHASMASALLAWELRQTWVDPAPAPRPPRF